MFCRRFCKDECSRTEQVTPTRKIVSFRKTHKEDMSNVYVHIENLLTVIVIRE